MVIWIIQDDGPIAVGYRHMGNKVSITHGVIGRDTSIALVDTEVNRVGWSQLWNYERIKQWFKLGHIMSIRAAYDERQRDATLVHQQAYFASIFFPDPWDSAPRPPAPWEPCPGSHPH